MLVGRRGGSGEVVYVRADLTAIAPGGQRVASDVRVVDRPVSEESSVSAQLRQAETEKFHTYMVQRGARLLPGGELMVPFILHSSGFASNSTWAFLLGLHTDVARN